MNGRSERPLTEAPADGATRLGRRRWTWSLWIAGSAVVLLLWQLGTTGRLDRLREWLFAPSAARYPVRGVDVSHHQGRVDWRRVKAAGFAFVYLKATEGADFRDTRFRQNWAEARSAGLVTGAYHFFTFCAPGVLQAEHFLAAMTDQDHVLPLGVDVEFTGNCKAWNSVPAIHSELRAFVERVEAARGEKLLLYTAQDQFGELIPSSLHGHALWIRSLWGEPSLPLAWLFWQYSDAGEVPGVEGRVDLNVFAGGWPEWRQRASAQLEP